MNKKVKWFYHPIADIALHPMGYPTNKIDQLAINSKDISTDIVTVKLLSNVYILGFPLGLGVHEIISPIAKKTQIASNFTTIVNSNLNPDLKFYLLDQALAQGYSGAPVFYGINLKPGLAVGGRPVKVEEKIIFIGIMSSVLSDASGGKYSLVVPIFYIWEILKSDEFIKYESQFSGKD